MRAPDSGLTLVELLAGVAVGAVLCSLVAGAGWKVYERSSLAVSAGNIRQLAAGAQAYLAENERRFWPFCERNVPSRTGAERGSRWWFGFEGSASLSRAEGQRDFDPTDSPLAGYVPKGLRPDPSLAIHGGALKPKYRAGYIGVGYNVVLAGGWFASTRTRPLSYWQLENPARTVVFATSAQVNTFQGGGSRPRIEDFYGLDQNETTVHFRHGGEALVAFADGSSGFLPLDESTRDSRLPEANIGRFAPRGSFQHLK